MIAERTSVAMLRVQLALFMLVAVVNGIAAVSGPSLNPFSVLGAIVASYGSYHILVAFRTPADDPEPGTKVRP